VKWNLRLVAAQREIWKASQLQQMLADAGLVISAGKMSHLWSGQPVTIRLADLDIICAVLDCAPNELLVRDSIAARRAVTPDAVLDRAVGHTGAAPIRRQPGRSRPPV
jgi:DNA-binding Xre family transcriptional regulator